MTFVGLVVTWRDVSDRRGIFDSAIPRFESWRPSLTVCDITKELAVKTRGAGVSEALSGSGLDLLINNAAILAPGPLEVLPLDAIRHEFDVNVFGALSVINAFLPALRKAHGRIVQVSTWTASACRCRSTDHQAHQRRRSKCSRRSTVPS